MPLKSFVEEIEGQGYSIVTDVLPPDFIPRCKAELMLAIEAETKLPYHNANDYAMVMVCSLYGGTFLELFTIPKLLEHMNAALGEGSIVYAYTSSSMPPRSANYSARIHVDCPRIIPGYITNLGVMITLDDFTEENGATWFLPRSQERAEAPGEEEFFANAKRVIAPAGSAWIFNARLWHCGGHNKTDRWRHALTINLGRPWMKQRIDLPRAMAHMDMTRWPDSVRQKLGFHAQVPASYDEYYVPPERRKFKQKYE